MNVLGRLLADLKKAGKTAEAKKKTTGHWKSMEKCIVFHKAILDDFGPLEFACKIFKCCIVSTCIN